MEDKPLYQIKLKNNLTNIVYTKKIVFPKGEVILDDIPESKLKFIQYPIEVSNHGNGIKTFAEESDCIVELKLPFCEEVISKEDPSYNRILEEISKLQTKINDAVVNGHQATDKDEYQPLREKLKYYRKRLGL